MEAMGSVHVTEDTAISVLACRVGAITLSAAAADATIQLMAASGGTVKWQMKCLVAAGQDAHITFPNPLNMGGGLYVDLTGTGAEASIQYRETETATS